MFTDLDMLYMAMAEVDKDRHFNTFCYSLNITSLNTLLDYNSKDSTTLDPAEIDIIKERIGHKYFNFKDLTKVTKTEETNVSNRHNMLRIPTGKSQHGQPMSILLHILQKSRMW